MIRSPTISGLAGRRSLQYHFCHRTAGYKRLMEGCPMLHNAFAWFYLGAFLVAVIAWFLLGNAQKMPQTTLQWGILVFLARWLPGLATLCGRRRDAGGRRTPAMTNMHVPAGLLVETAPSGTNSRRALMTGALVILAATVGAS